MAISDYNWTSIVSSSNGLPPLVEACVEAIIGDLRTDPQTHIVGSLSYTVTAKGHFVVPSPAHCWGIFLCLPTHPESFAFVKRAEVCFRWWNSLPHIVRNTPVCKSPFHYFLAFFFASLWTCSQVYLYLLHNKLETIRFLFSDGLGRTIREEIESLDQIVMHPHCSSPIVKSHINLCENSMKWLLITECNYRNTVFINKKIDDVVHKKGLKF